MTIRSHWHQHPGVRSNEQLTVGERAADTIRNGMGSWGFVTGALIFLAGWIGNGNHGFDKYPFILLNLILSCLAAMQGSILLIAAKRADQVSSELALHDYQTKRRGRPANPRRARDDQIHSRAGRRPAHRLTAGGVLRLPQVPL